MSGRLRSWIASTVVAAALMACGGSGAMPVPSPTAAALVADIDLGGRTIHVVCSGTGEPGRPTVIFESAGGATWDNWSGVTSALEKTTRTCAYDRAGIGQSDPAPAPRTVRDQATDLAAVLEGAGIAGPIVLVAHSSGGWNAIVYAADHPEQVVGAVLVDIQPPGLTDRFLQELPPETTNESEVIKQLREGFTTFTTDPSMNPENLRIADGEEEAKAAPGFGARPTEILWSTDTRERWPGIEADLAAHLDAAIDHARDDVEAMADSPNVTRVDTGHFIHDERPEVVIEAIKRVLAALE